MLSFSHRQIKKLISSDLFSPFIKLCYRVCSFSPRTVNLPLQQIRLKIQATKNSNYRFAFRRQTTSAFGYVWNFIHKLQLRSLYLISSASYLQMVSIKYFSIFSKNIFLLFQAQLFQRDLQVITHVCCYVGISQFLGSEQLWNISHLISS